jgi:hypothetical protein
MDSTYTTQLANQIENPDYNSETEDFTHKDAIEPRKAQYYKRLFRKAERVGRNADQRMDYKAIRDIRVAQSLDINSAINGTGNSSIREREINQALCVMNFDYGRDS